MHHCQGAEPSPYLYGGLSHHCHLSSLLCMFLSLFKKRIVLRFRIYVIIEALALETLVEATHEIPTWPMPFVVTFQLLLDLPF